MKPEKFESVAGYVFSCAALAMLATPGIWAYQIYHWLRWGTWQSISVADWLQWAGWGTPGFRWVGVQRISDFVVGLPLSIMIFAAILGLLVAFIQWGESLTGKER